MADQAARLKTIADSLEETYKSLKRAGANIAGLLQAGRATCDEVRAYNLWALAIYNTQRGMLATLRAGGEKGVAELPPTPMLFTWKGTTGADAWKVSCAGEATSLSGIMKRTLRGPTKAQRYLSTDDIQISTQDASAFDPTSAPSFKTLLEVQTMRAQQAPGLGIIGVLIVIAGIAIAVSVAIAAIMHYLEVSDVQEANTAQTKLQADAFANYTAARLSCLSSCTQGGKSVEDCTAICAELITKPDIKIPGLDEPWGLLKWVGFTVVAGAGTMFAWKLYKRRAAGKPMFELPESVEHAINP